MGIDLAIWCFTALVAKHFICDFLFQTEFQWRNKGNLWHPGGYAHAAICVIGTTIALHVAFLAGTISERRMMVASLLLIVPAEFILHYAIDWAKVNITKRFGLGPTTHESFWWLLGLDQFLHYMCYVAIVAFLAFNLN